MYLLKKRWEWFEYQWKGASKWKKVWIYTGIYTIVFLLAYMLAYSPFLLSGKSFIWQTDGRLQHYPFLVYFSRAIRRHFAEILRGNTAVPLFELSLGVGGDMINLLNSMGLNDPLALIAAFCPIHYMEYLYAFLTIFRVYLAGLSFSVLCKYFGKPALHGLIGSLIYCFSGYALFCSMRHPFFLPPMIQLPLLIVGLDKVLKRDKPYLFIAGIFYAALSEYYHLYMITILLVLYALVRFFDLYSSNRLKQFLNAVVRSAAFYLIGLGLSAVVFLPAVMGFLSAGRVGFSNYTSGHDWSWYRGRLLRFIAPSGSWNYMSLAAPVLFAFLLLFLSKRRRTMKILTVLALLLYFTGIGGLIMNGFQYESSRWTFGLALLAAAVVVELLPELLSLSPARQLVCMALVCTYVIFLFSTSAARKTNYGLVGALFLALTLLVLTIRLEPVCGIAGFARGREILCLVLVICNVGVNGIYLYAADQGNYMKEFQESGFETHLLENSMERELEPYLLEDPVGRADSTSFCKNIGLVWHIPGMLAYYSTLPGNITEFWNTVENSTGQYALHNVASTSQMTAATTLLSEKYHIEQEKRQCYVPFGYSLLKKTSNGNFLYENDYALPLGYTYDTAVPYSIFEGLNGIQAQQAMLQSIALEGIEEAGSQLAFCEQVLPYEMSFKNCSWEDGVLSVKEQNASITFEFDMPAAVEGYIRLAGLDTSGFGRSSLKVQASCGDVTRSALAYSKQFTWYYGRENYLFNLGWSEEARTACTVSFDSKGTFPLKEIQILALPMEQYTEQVEALREEPLENIRLSTNRITGTVDLSRDKILCMSIPYSKGWTAKVDGVPTEIQQGNIMFMALPLAKGYHEIEFTYCAPGLLLGSILSLLSLMLLAAYYIYDRKKR